MSKPIQLIINDVAAPTTTRDRYQSYEVEAKEILTMADYSATEEIAGYVQKIVYSYDKMDDATYQALRAALYSKGPKTVSYLPDNGTTELITSQFLVESITPATLQFYLNGVPRWHGLGFVLREVRPHD